MRFKGLPIKKIPKNFLWCGHTMANATLRYRQAQYKSCPLTIKDGQDAHPTKSGNLFLVFPKLPNDKEPRYVGVKQELHWCQLKLKFLPHLVPSGLSSKKL
ncbi:hypothetical protein OA07_08250 [Aphanizomenon flos-aquae 2012/KM1/D3]|nr:hypothetical protein OA07_08250 [Aphanizomenon flos-aquae 2012/KM1/D3]